MSPGEGLYVVAGPCSAESAEQVLGCARALRSGGMTRYFRAGAWKPRTRPGGFEGFGAAALPWLSAVQSEVGLPVCVEVATPEHVELALRHGIRGFWIGARTTSDPFAIEALARAIPTEGCDVFVKNPISPDVSLWIGAVERFMRQGHRGVMGVHRGFYSPDAGPYRNAPGWESALGFRSELSGVKLLCDPSHIAGRSELVPAVSQRALDFSFDGLFVEVHPDPPRALSDARQQLTPSAFGEMLRTLRVSSPLSGDADELIRGLRARIDCLDERLLGVLVERMDVVREIGAWKMARNIRTYDPARWDALLQHHARYACAHGLCGEFVRGIFSLVHSESLRAQGEMRGGPPEDSD